jgi:hypothetical protein
MPNPRQSGSEGRPDVKIELLHIFGCPNTDVARVLLRKVPRELGRTDQISQVQVSNAEQAQALKFPASPTIRIEDVDVETPLPRQASYGLCCRMYMIEGRIRRTSHSGDDSQGDPGLCRRDGD